MPVTLSLAGRVALISGGSRGIGAATVKMFAAAGAKVAFNFHKAKVAADRIVQECGADQCFAVQANLADSASAKPLVDAAVSRFGRLDILVANHGVWPAEDAAIDQMKDEQWRSTLAINVESVFGLIKHAVGQMKKQFRQKGRPAGHVVLVSSTAGQSGEAFHCDYAASKGALLSMVKGLSTELAPDGIHRHIIAVAPEEIETRFLLAYTGAPRKSGINNWEVFKAHINGDKRVYRNFERISQIARAMYQAVAESDWDDVER